MAALIAIIGLQQLHIEKQNVIISSKDNEILKKANQIEVCSTATETLQKSTDLAVKARQEAVVKLDEYKRQKYARITRTVYINPHDQCSIIMQKMKIKALELRT